MIGVGLEILIVGLTDPGLDSICDAFARVDPVLDDLADWSVGADLQSGKVEIELTLDVASAEAAVVRAKEILGLVMELTGFAQLDFAAASKIMAEVVAA